MASGSDEENDIEVSEEDDDNPRDEDEEIKSKSFVSSSHPPAYYQDTELGQIVDQLDKSFNENKIDNKAMKDLIAKGKTMNPKEFYEEFNKAMYTIVSPYIKSKKFPKDIEKFYKTAQDVKKLLDDKLKKEDASQKELIKCKRPLEKQNLTFDMLAGMEAEKNDMKISFIYPSIYTSLFPTQGKGILLYSPPGAGKTALARASAHEIKNAVYYAPLPGELMGKYEGETQKNITAVFECADDYLRTHPEKKLAIIFFDEFDSLAPQRGENNPGAERSVNTLLQMMDGIKSNSKISVIAATNFISKIDEAVLSRFKDKIFVDLPDVSGREFIIRNELKKYFSWPGSKRNELSFKNMEEDKEYMKLIQTYSGYILKEKEGKIRSGKIKDQYITDEFVKLIVKETGPKNSAEVMKVIKKMGKRTDDSEFHHEARDKWGYSARDLIMLMSIILGLVGSRAVSNPERNTVYEYKKGEEEYYIYNPLSVRNNDSGMEILISDDLSNLKKITLDKVKDKSKIITFDIRESDFRAALTRNPSSIKDYEKYIVFNSEE